MLAGTHAETQGGYIIPAHWGLLHDLAVDRRNAYEDGRAMLGNQPHPQARIILALMNNDRLSPIEGIHQAGTKYIGQVEFAGMQDAIDTAGIEIAPLFFCRFAADQAAIPRQHSFGVPGFSTALYQ